MRTYSFIVFRPGAFEFYPPKLIRSKARIRVVVVVMFRRWFGRAATVVWAKDGFMAEARDNRGNLVQLEQYNAPEIYQTLAANGSTPVALIPARCQQSQNNLLARAQKGQPVVSSYLPGMRATEECGRDQLQKS